MLSSTGYRWAFQVSVGVLALHALSAAAPAGGRCGRSWVSPIGEPGVNDEVLALAAAPGRSAVGPAVYAGGRFTRAGDEAAGFVAAWTGARWLPLAGGVNDRVTALAVFDEGGGPNVFAGGWFTQAGDAPTPYLARWDGAAWSAVGENLSGPVFALHAFDDGDGPAIYLGGNFMFAGEVAARRIARWDGEHYAALGPGLSSFVNALIDFDDGNGPALYAAGTFRTTADGNVTLNRVGKWDGVQWRPLGDGLPNTVFALAVYDDGGGAALYAGGLFRKDQGAPSDRVAKWDGRQWLPVGDTLNGNVYTLTVFDDGGGPVLIAGGNFLVANGQPAPFLARWDGRTWKGTDGPNEIVQATAVFDDGSGPGLYAGGLFTQAGEAAASNVARWGCSRCDKVRRVTARCVPRTGEVRAVVRTGLTAGAELVLDLDDKQSQAVSIDESGRGRVRFAKPTPGEHKVCVQECAGRCSMVECEG